MKVIFQAEVLSVWHFLDYFHYIYNLCFPEFFLYSFRTQWFLEILRFLEVRVFDFMNAFF